MKNIGYITVSAIILAYDLVMTGFVTSKLWSWFVVPHFHVDEISVPVAAGIASIVAYLTHKVITPKITADFDEVLLSAAIQAIIRPFFVLAFAFVVKQFV